jgi:hypothetical protein
MNKRIDELMIEAGARFEFLHGVHYDDFQYKKFAELIVKECAEVLDETISPPSHPMNSIGYRLKEHFGVKE